MTLLLYEGKPAVTLIVYNAIRIVCSTITDNRFKIIAIMDFD